MYYNIVLIICVFYFRLYEGKGQETFETSMYEMLSLVTNLMCSNADTTLFLQGACLKYLPHSIPDIMTVFSVTKLRYIVFIVVGYLKKKMCILRVSLFFCYSSLLVELIINVPPSRLVKQKLITMSDIVHSKIFLNKDCRAILLPSFLARIKELLESSDEVVFCTKLYLF